MKPYHQKEIKQIFGWKLQILCFLLVWMALIIFYRGFPQSDDELLFASAAQSYAVYGKLEALQMFGNERIRGQYGLIAPLHVLLGSSAYHLAKLLHGGFLQFLFLLNSIYAALTAVYLIKIALIYGYNRETALLSALVFGAATLALPYAQTFFREPLAMLCLAAAFYHLEKYLLKITTFKYHFIDFALFVFCFGLAVWTKEMLVVAAPFFIFYLIKNRRKTEEKTGLRKNTFWWIAVLLVLLLPVFAVFSKAKGRFSFSFLEHIIYFLPRMPHDYLLKGTFGLFVSPGEGFFIYMPFFLLGFLNPYKNPANQVKKVRGPIILATTSLALVQAYVYNYQWWNYTWGARVLLPMIPLWMVLMLPWMQVIFEKPNKFKKYLIVGLIILSVFIQVEGALVSAADYVDALANKEGILLSEKDMWDWDIAALIYYPKMLFAGYIQNLALMRVMNIQPVLLIAAFILSILLMLARILFFPLGHKNSRMRSVGNALLSGLTVLAVLLAIVSMLKTDSVYHTDYESFQQAREIITKEMEAGRFLVVYPYAGPFWFYYFNGGFPTKLWASLPSAKFSLNGKTAFFPHLEESMQKIESLVLNYREKFILLDGRSASAENAYIQALLKNGYVLTQEYALQSDPTQNSLMIFLFQKQ